jgi:hypothetical protein
VRLKRHIFFIGRASDNKGMGSEPSKNQRGLVIPLISKGSLLDWSRMILRASSTIHRPPEAVFPTEVMLKDYGIEVWPEKWMEARDRHRKEEMTGKVIEQFIETFEAFCDSHLKITYKSAKSSVDVGVNEYELAHTHLRLERWTTSFKKEILKNTSIVDNLEQERRRAFHSALSSSALLYDLSYDDEKELLRILSMLGIPQVGVSHPLICIILTAILAHCYAYQLKKNNPSPPLQKTSFMTVSFLLVGLFGIQILLEIVTLLAFERLSGESLFTAQKLIDLFDQCVEQAHTSGRNISMSFQKDLLEVKTKLKEAS